ncbi:2-dehydropantoate 2-reductase [Metabacillus herbersteinensis]|uniref:2-dehydropantoate 2-reductase n=1 Tax=Metabacillus herbersteinensis TaxID=283816 RepID=A0ABV6GC83_9BACI
MKIGVIGSGAIGLLFSYYLSRKHSVTLYTKGEAQASVIREKGLSLVRDGEILHTSLQAKQHPSYEEEFLVVTVKQYHLQSIIERLQNSPSKTILFLQNGMDHLKYLPKLSHHRLLIGVVEHGAMRMNDHTVEQTGIGQSKFASYNEPNHQFIHSILNDQIPSFPFKYEENWYEMMAEKLIVNATINPLTALLHVKNGALIENEYYKVILRALFEEVFVVLELKNKEMFWNHVVTICEVTAKNQSSMYKDVQAKKQTEVEAIVGYVLREAKRLNLQVPHSTFLFHAIKGLEVGEE